MVSNWNFAEAMVQGVRYHHQPEMTEKYRPLVNAVAAADAVSNAVGLGPAGRAAELDDPSTLPDYGFDRKAVLTLISELRERTTRLVQLTR